MTDMTVRTDLVDGNPWQPRQGVDPDGVAELALSIARGDGPHNGLLQVPVARPNPGEGGLYQLVLGHRRLLAFRLNADIAAGVAAGNVNGHRSDLVEAVRAALEAGRSFDEIPLDVQDLTDQQMFEQAVTENLQRRDLNPLEQAAAEKRYMEEFGKTSEQAGQFFGKSAATIRGDVRLLDLPEEARTLLAGGAISVGAARLLLSAAKVLIPREFQAVLRDIQAGEDLPEICIRRAFSNAHGVSTMWQKYNGGVPRGGRDGWKLDMKNFPNHMLAPLSPDKQAEAEQAGILEHLTNPPACTACPYYVKISGDHFCGRQVCFFRKQVAYKAQKIADLGRTLGIGIYQKSDGAYIALESGRSSHKKAFDSRNPDLRLINDVDYKGAWMYQDFEGLDRSIVKLVVVGKSIEKLAVSGSHTKGGKLTEGEKAERRAMKVYRQRRKQLMWEYCNAAQHLFAGLPPDVVKRLKAWHYVGVDDQFAKEYSLEAAASDEQKNEYARCELVLAMVSEACNHYVRDSLAKSLKKMEGMATIPAPAELVDLAGKWDEEIEALARVSTETEEE